MIIRKAKLVDVAEIVKMWKEFINYHDHLLTGDNKHFFTRKKNAPDIFKKFIQKNIRSKNAMVYIAEINGKIAGYSLAIIRKNIPIHKIKKAGEIVDLFVKKEFRGLGISSKFKDEIIKWFKKKGIEEISLKVYPNNKPAYPIYKKWGFIDYQIEMRKKI